MTAVATGTGNSALGEAAGWIDAVFHGPIMSSIAMLAIAALGYAMLQGRLSVRRGGAVVLGCFIAFGAPLIARSLVTLAREQAPAAPAPGTPISALPPPCSSATAGTQAIDDDPYAGASVRR